MVWQNHGLYYPKDRFIASHDIVLERVQEDLIIDFSRNSIINILLTISANVKNVYQLYFIDNYILSIM